MTTRSLDDKFLQALKPIDGKQREVFDAASPGLSIRVSGSGKVKSWSLTYKPPGSRKNRRHPLGTYPLVTLKQARTAASEAKGEISAGRPPPRQKAAGAPETVADLVENRLEFAVRNRLDKKTGKVGPLRSQKEIERRYKHIVAAVGSVRIDQFNIEDLNKVVDPLFKAKKYRAAGMAHTDLEALFNHAVGRGSLPYNPIKKATRFGSLGQERKRYLSKEEIQAFWAGIGPSMGEADSTPTILKLILVTLQRPVEVSGMRRSELAIEKQLWTIPGARTKNGLVQEVPLTPLAIDLIKAALVKSTDDLVFPSQKRKGSYSRNSVGQALDRILKPTEELPLGRLGMNKFTPHDLRRTGSTHLSLDESGLKFSDSYIDYVLNHVTERKKSVTAKHYNKNQRLAEKREALGKWDEFLRGLIGIKAVPKKAKAG